MNRRRLLIIILVAFFSVSLILCGKVIAYMFQQTQYEENLFTIAEVSCEVKEEFDGVNKTSIQIQNTGNIEVYIRVRLVSYWVDTEGNIVAKPSAIPTINLESDWLAGTNNTYYYKSVVAPNKLTNELLESSLSLQIDSEGYLQVIEVFAEAMQSKPIEAVTDSWGVTINSSGYITAVP